MKDSIKEKTANRSRKRSRIKMLLAAAFVILDALLIAECVYSNTHIETEYFDYSSDKIPQSFDGFKIVQISDYHDHGNGFEQKLIGIVKDQQPDIILLTGDLVDSQYTDLEGTKDFLRDVSQIAQCYMVWGNHDMRLTNEQREEISLCCEESGISLLEDRAEYFEIDGERITIAGSSGVLNGSFDELREEIRGRAEDEEGKGFVLWINHYPEDAPYIVEDGTADLLFCGHAHGGLIRLPFINGIYAPGQGLFPEYTSGEYDYGEGKMIVSRGVGNSSFSLRMFDSFHLVVCTLRSE